MSCKYFYHMTLIIDLDSKVICPVILHRNYQTYQFSLLATQADITPRPHSLRLRPHDLSLPPDILFLRGPVSSVLNMLPSHLEINSPITLFKKISLQNITTTLNNASWISTNFHLYSSKFKECKSLFRTA